MLPFFSWKHFWKVLNPSVTLFWLQISSAFAIIFADYHGLSCVHVWASWYTALFRVSLHGVELKCVGLAQKISARFKSGSYVSPFSLFAFLFSFLHYQKGMFFLISSTRSHRFESRLWKVNMDQNWNLFYHYFFQRIPVIYNFIS